MKFTKNFKLTRWIGYFTALIFVVLVIYFSNSMVKELEKEEQDKVDLLAKAQKEIVDENNQDIDYQLFLLSIIEKNKTIPVILTDDKKNYITHRNLDESILNDKEKLTTELKEMQKNYAPIPVEIGNQKQYLYYKNSHLHHQLQNYPYYVIGFLVLFILFTIWYFNTLREKEESLLWAGMAKETTHQIGTPLSSLIGWIELLKFENINQDTIKEMEQDINRLNIITERFSKIGSTAELTEKKIAEVIEKTINYLKLRISKNIVLTFDNQLNEKLIKLNEPLISWVLENLIKNAVDAIKTKGEIGVKLHLINNNCCIDVSDTGSGIAQSKKKEVFKAGFTTKKRGWGLGLSLAKRIIEDYHNGKIFVLKTEIGKGTTFRIELFN